MRHLRELKINFGTFKSISETFKYKTEAVEHRGRHCMISVDEIKN